jgi:hypothetical protein
MSDDTSKAGPPQGCLWVGRNEQNEIVINHPDLHPDENGVGHIVFSPAQARHLAGLLLNHAADEWETTITVDESQRQATVLALASMALQRPGWDFMISEIADKFAGREMYESFKRFNADRIKPL